MAVAAISTPVTKTPSPTILEPGQPMCIRPFFTSMPAMGNRSIFQPTLMRMRTTRDSFQLFLLKNKA